MSDPSHPVANAATDNTSPDFDAAEVKFFGQEDGHATIAISRMLVLFFFYSLLIMGTVVYIVHSQWMSKPADSGHDGHSQTAPY